VNGFTSCTVNVSYHLKVNGDLIAIFSVSVFNACSSSSRCTIRFFVSEFIKRFVRKNVIITFFLKCSKIYGIDYFVQITLIFDIFDESDPNSMVKLLRFCITESTWWLQGLMFHSAWWFEVLSWAWPCTFSFICNWPSGTLLIESKIALFCRVITQNVLYKVLFIYSAFAFNLFHQQIFLI